MKLLGAGTFCALIVTALLAGCGGKPDSSYSLLQDTGKGGPVEWTVLVFLNADNNLEEFGILNVNQMEQIGSTDKVKIVVQMDRSPGYDTTNGDWTGTRRFLVTKGDTPEITSPVLEDMGEVDMGNPTGLSDFIRWGQANYPANHYCLVIWNHGSGWRSSATLADTIPRNISFDDTTQTSIRTTDLPGALAAANPHFDVVAMDASLMQMLEVAYEMRDSARYLVGSEESPPGEGYPYHRWLGRLASDPAMSPENLSKIIVQEFVDEYNGVFSVTQSVVDLSRMADVAQAADALAGALIPLAGSKAAAIASARDSSQSYAYAFYKDLVDFSGRVSSLLGDPNISAANAALQAAIASAVISEGHTGSSVAQSHGLSIYVPEPTTYLSTYNNLAFARDTRWDEFLKAQGQ